MARRARESRLPAPYLRRIWLDDAALEAHVQRAAQQRPSQSSRDLRVGLALDRLDPQLPLDPRHHPRVLGDSSGDRELSLHADPPQQGGAVGLQDGRSCVGNQPGLLFPGPQPETFTRGRAAGPTTALAAAVWFVVLPWRAVSPTRTSAAGS